MTINIQIHAVKSAHWEPREHAHEPRILVIETVTGEQRITLFPIRPETRETTETVEPGIPTPPPKAA